MHCIMGVGFVNVRFVKSTKKTCIGKTKTTFGGYLPLGCPRVNFVFVLLMCLLLYIIGKYKILIKVCVVFDGCKIQIL